MNHKSNETKRLETAILLARMYGVKETLEPLTYHGDEWFISEILKLTEEYLEGGSELLNLFEKRQW